MPDEDIDEVEVDYIGSNKLKKSRERHDLRLNYDSDSTDEDYAEKDGLVVEEPKIEAAEEDDDDDDDDMFASDNEGDTKNEPTDKLTKLNDVKSEVDGPKEYDELDQVEVDNDGEMHDYYNNVENVEDYLSLRNAKLKEPKMEAFIETEEGDVTAELPEEDEKELAEDLWSRDFKHDDIIKAKRAQEQRLATLAKSKPISATEDLLAGLIEFLEPAETPLEALARFKPKNRKKNKIITDDEETRRKNVLDLTDLCEELINEKQFPDTYDMSREELLRAYKLETGIDYKQAKGIKRRRDEDDEEIDEGDDSGINYGEKIWEFKWSENDTINGPYSSYEMLHWKEGYFTHEVLVRKIGEPHFLSLDAVVFD